MGEHTLVVADTAAIALGEVILDLIGWDESRPHPAGLDDFTSAIDTHLALTVGGEARVYNDMDEDTLYVQLGDTRVELRLPLCDPRSFVVTAHALVHGGRIKWRCSNVPVHAA